MRADKLSLLRCTYCTSRLELTDTVVEDALGVFFGSVTCSECGSQFPIIGGVLIVQPPSPSLDHMPAQQHSRSRRILKTLCRMVRERNEIEALSRLLNPCAGPANLLVRPRRSFHDRAAGTGLLEARASTAVDAQRQPLIPAGMQGFVDRLTGDKLLRWSRRRIARFLLDHIHELTGWEAINLYYSQFSRSHMAEYFAYRFCRPRHLAALSLASVVRRREGPVLDLACGVGHMTHYLSDGDEAPAVIGVDGHYPSLFVARNFIAPQADFLCQAADTPLPLAATFDSVVCSDAFYYLSHKGPCVREMRRLVGQDGLIVLPGFSDMTGNPRGRIELTASGYHRLFGSMRHVFLPERRLMRSYLQRKGPDLTNGDVEKTEHQRWWCAVASNNPETFREHPGPQQWPHSVGRLVLNPIYRMVEDTGAGIILRREFPSAWYADEREVYVDHAPDIVEVPKRLLESMEAGHRSEELDDLVDRFVVIGVPPRFLASAGLT